MTAVEVLRTALAAGVEINLHGDSLVLEASFPPPDSVLEALAQNKAGIIALLRRGDDGWSPLDWQALFDERAGIAEFDGDLPRPEAEVRSFACCIAEWMSRHPQACSPDRCLAGNRGDSDSDPLLPFGTNTHGHCWLHSRCWAGWHQALQDDAVTALIALGVEKPADFPNDFGNNGSK